MIPQVCAGRLPLVLDRSGSMGGSRFALAREAVAEQERP
jgi:uncharacterized protein with von Willebrand factor type A (vWA) domain